MLEHFWWKIIVTYIIVVVALIHVSNRRQTVNNYHATISRDKLYKEILKSRMETEFVIKLVVYIIHLMAPSVVSSSVLLETPTGIFTIC